MNNKILIFFIFLLFMPEAIAQQEINLTSLTLEEKIAQMVMVRGDNYDPRLMELGIGGIQLDRQKTFQEYKDLIEKYQNQTKLKLLVTTDLEGYWNPFSFFPTKDFSQIQNSEEAYRLGAQHAQILNALGFTTNFSPVVESKNKVWPGRSFTGSSEEIKQKISSYTKILEKKGIIATAKHYPGGNLIKDPHKFKVKAQITQQDLEFFEEAIKANVSAIMVGHTIVQGALNSNKKQSTLSPQIISHLRENQKFSGLIITDAIGMWGLKWSYLLKPKQLYPDLVKAGNDIILEIQLSNYLFKSSPYKKARQGISAIEKAVKSREIPESRIDESVERILKAKGYKVTN